MPFVKDLFQISKYLFDLVSVFFILRKLLLKLGHIRIFVKNRFGNRREKNQWLL